MAVPMLLYDRKCWIIGKWELQQLQAVEMGSWWSVKGGKRLHKIGNEVIRKELRVISMNDKMVKTVGYDMLKGLKEKDCWSRLFFVGPKEEDFPRRPCRSMEVGTGYQLNPWTGEHHSSIYVPVGNSNIKHCLIFQPKQDW